jgi:hypothetical protein
MTLTWPPIIAFLLLPGGLFLSREVWKLAAPSKEPFKVPCGRPEDIRVIEGNGANR